MLSGRTSITPSTAQTHPQTHSACGIVPLIRSPSMIRCPYIMQTPRNVYASNVTSMGQSIMDRSTISDGLPSFPATSGTDIALHPVCSQQPQTGHLSLDRRQLGGRGSFGQYGLGEGGRFSSGRHADFQRQPGRYTNPELSHHGTPSVFVRSNAPAYAVPNEFSGPMGFDPYNTSNIQRSYSLRARSQPPSDALRPAASSSLDQRITWNQQANFNGAHATAIYPANQVRDVCHLFYQNAQ